MLFFTTFARHTFTVSLNELFENYTGRRTHVYSGRMNRLKSPPEANPVKLHLLLSGEKTNLYALINNFKITNSKSEILLGITFDNELKFNEHVSNLCIKATNKLHVLARISHYMNTDQKRIIMKTFIQSQLGYCPLVWMFCSRTINARINRMPERS